MSDWTQDLAVGWELLLLTLTARRGTCQGSRVWLPVRERLA